MIVVVAEEVPIVIEDQTDPIATISVEGPAAAAVQSSSRSAETKAS